MRACTVLLVILRAAMGNAQSWLPDEAVWHYDYVSGFGAQGFVRVEIVGDTVVDGLTCKRLNPTQHGFNFISGTSFSNQLTSILLQESDGLVRAHVPMLGFDTLYHMHAVPGDVWRLARLPGTRICADDSFVLVTDTGTTIVSGITLRWLAVDVHFMPAGVVESDTVLERVGTLRHYLLPHDACNGWVDGQQGGSFRCYTDSQVSYSSTSGLPCGFILHTASVVNRPGISVYPNPGSGGVWVSWPSGILPRTIVLFDSMGRVALRSAVQPNGFVDLAALLLVPTSWPCTSLTGIP